MLVLAILATSVAALRESAEASLARAWVPARPLMSRKRSPLETAVRAALRLVGSGRAVGAIMPTTGFSSAPGVARSVLVGIFVLTGEISGGGRGMGESCQCQKRVMSSFSAELERPRTASA